MGGVASIPESREIKILDEAKKRICELNASSEEEASCALSKYPAVVILVMVCHFDAPAITKMFIMTALDSYSLTVIPKSDDHPHSTSV